MISNFYGKEVIWDAGRGLNGYTRLLGNYEDSRLNGTKAELRPYETVVLYRQS